MRSRTMGELLRLTDSLDFRESERLFFPLGLNPPLPSSPPSLAQMRSRTMGELLRLTDSLEFRESERLFFPLGLNPPLPSSPPSLAQMRSRTMGELLRLTDSLEFRESEMLRTRAELRSTRAEVSALEGRFAAEFRCACGLGVVYCATALPLLLQPFHLCARPWQGDEARVGGEGSAAGGAAGGLCAIEAHLCRVLPNNNPLLPMFRHSPSPPLLSFPHQGDEARVRGEGSAAGGAAGGLCAIEAHSSGVAQPRE
ncbi:unnamed protein product [Closterium sp. NIES-54]